MSQIKFECGTFYSYKELCKLYKINYSTFMSRIYRGWNLQDAVYGRIPKNWKPIRFKNITFKSNKEMCEYFNVPYSSFKDKIKQGYSIINAMEDLTKNLNYHNKQCERTITVIYQGNIYSNMKIFCDEFNINYKAFQQRHRRGHSLDECIKYFLNKNKELIDEQ